MTAERVAVLGTGIQGTAIVDRLVAAGIVPVVYDRVEAQMLRASALGARVAPSSSDAIAQADIVMLVLPAGDAPLQLLATPETRAALAPRHLVLQMGSAGVEQTHSMSELVTSTGARFAECVLAGPIAALMDATCELLFGGDERELQRVAPTLRAFGKLRRTGAVGTANAFNLAALAQVYATIHGFALACGMIERSGLDIAQYLDFVRNGVAGHPAQILTDFLWPAHFEKRAYALFGPVQVRNDCALEETKLLARHARALHLNAGLVDALAATHSAAAGRDLGADWTSVYDELVKPRPLVGARLDEGDDDDDVSASGADGAAAAARRLRSSGWGFVTPDRALAAAGLRVRDGMNARVARVREHATLAEVAELMAVTQASDIAVVDEDRRFLGVISEGDVIRALLPDFDEVVLARGSLTDAATLFVATATSARRQPISRLVIRDPLTLTPDDDLLRAAVVMVEKMIRRLPVVEHGKFVGSLSRGDLCWVLLNAEGA